ncbi:MAG TPA: type II secretion system protein, partial [Candidatus Saccharimonadales bacterium]|nr:type II secretion system protein [Candidatus Saccharimonadales bacterium]
KRTEGFTIIEVLIVLAIAGLILLIVFLAVPALQRNSRNTQRRNDVAKLLAAVQEYSNNNRGILPATGSGQFNIEFAPADPNLGFYTDDTLVFWDKNDARGVTPGNVTNLNVVRVYNFAKCTAGNVPATLTGASARSLVAMYAIENSGGGFVSQCLES